MHKNDSKIQYHDFYLTTHLTTASYVRQSRINILIRIFNMNRETTEIDIDQTWDNSSQQIEGAQQILFFNAFEISEQRNRSSMNPSGQDAYLGKLFHSDSPSQYKIRGLQGSAINIQGRVANIQGRVTNLQGKMANIQERITNLQGRVANIQDRVANLQRKVDQISCQLKQIKEILYLLIPKDQVEKLRRKANQRGQNPEIKEQQVSLAKKKNCQFENQNLIQAHRSRKVSQLQSLSSIYARSDSSKKRKILKRSKGYKNLKEIPKKRTHEKKSIEIERNKRQKSVVIEKKPREMARNQEKRLKSKAYQQIAKPRLMI